MRGPAPEADRYDPEGFGEMALIGCGQPAARILARFAVPQLPADDYARFAARARAGDQPEELAADFAMTAQAAQVLMVHLECWPGAAVLAARARAAARPRRSARSFIELSQPEERE